MIFITGPLYSGKRTFAGKLGGRQIFGGENFHRGLDIAAAAGVDKEEAAKVIKKLAKEGKIYSPKRCFYDIRK